MSDGRRLGLRRDGRPAETVCEPVDIGVADPHQDIQAQLVVARNVQCGFGAGGLEVGDARAVPGRCLEEPDGVGRVDACGDVVVERGASFRASVSLGVVAVLSRHPPGRERTRALIEDLAGGELGAKLRSQMIAWHPGATREDVEEAFQEACVHAARACQGQTEGEVFTWLRTTTRHELGRMRRRAGRRARLEVLADVSTLDVQPGAGAAAPEQELIDREDLADVECVTSAVLARLSDAQCAVAVLHADGRRRPEIAEQLGMTPRSVKRALERILSVGRDELVRLAGHGCDSGEALVARFAFGLATGREVRQAQLHLAGCSRCGELYEHLGVWRGKVAALLPVPAVTQTHPRLPGRALGGALDALCGLLRHVGDGVSAAREHVAAAAAHLKQQATAIYVRAVDPTPLAGVRPGATAAAVAGCLAVGGGTSYCVQQSVDPIAGLTDLVASAHHAKRSKAPTKVRAAQEPAPAVPTPTPPPAPVTPPASQPVVAAPQPSTPPAPAPTPTPQDEYEPTAAPATQSAASRSSSTTSKPAPAPTGGSGEFDGP